MADTALTETEQLVLLALLRRGSDAYGVSIAADIADRTTRVISLGAIYKALDRLEDRGFVVSRIGDPTPERGGRRKKHYRVQAAGQRAVKHALEVIRSMTDGLEAELR